MAEDLYALDLEVDLDSAHYGGLASCNPPADIGLNRETDHASGLAFFVHADAQLPLAGLIDDRHLDVNARLGLLFQGYFIFIKNVLLVV